MSDVTEKLGHTQCYHSQARESGVPLTTNKVMLGKSGILPEVGKLGIALKDLDQLITCQQSINKRIGVVDKNRAVKFRIMESRRQLAKGYHPGDPLPVHGIQNEPFCTELLNYVLPKIKSFAIS